MADWRPIVYHRLGRIRLPAPLAEEVVAELAAHLEDAAAQFQFQGCTEEDAAAAALRQVQDWRRLRREIEKSRENPMNNRTRQILLPAMVTLLLSALLQAVIYNQATLLRASGLQEATTFPWGPTALVLSLPWLALLPLVGAAGAYWSRHEGGVPSHRLLAALAPALVMGAVLLAILLIGMFIQPQVPWALRFAGIAAYLTGSVALPALALALGAAPFLKAPSKSSPTGAVV